MKNMIFHDSWAGLGLLGQMIPKARTRAASYPLLSNSNSKNNNNA